MREAQTYPRQQIILNYLKTGGYYFVIFTD